MSNFGKKREDQLFYKNTKLERANEELVNRINNELLPAIAKLKNEVDVSKRVIISALFERGGSIDIPEEDYNNACAKIMVRVDSDTKMVTCHIESDPENVAE